MSSHSFWTKLDTFTPIVCRLLARVRSPSGGVVAKTVEQIAKDSGLPPAEILSLSWLSSWDDVPVKKARAFTKGCGIDLTNRENLRGHSSYIRKNPTFKYLKKSADWTAVYQPMIKAYAQYR